MRRIVLTTLTLGSLLLLSCGSEKTNEEVQAVVPVEETTTETMKPEEASEKISSDIEQLKKTTEETTNELDELLNDI